jgi:hypothetical protein
MSWAELRRWRWRWRREAKAARARVRSCRGAGEEAPAGASAAVATVTATTSETGMTVTAVEGCLCQKWNPATWLVIVRRCEETTRVAWKCSRWRKERRTRQPRDTALPGAWVATSDVLRRWRRIVRRWDAMHVSYRASCVVPKTPQSPQTPSLREHAFSRL